MGRNKICEEYLSVTWSKKLFMDNYKCIVHEITYGSTYHMISNILPSTIEIPELSLLYRSCAQYVPGDISAWYEIINILQYSHQLKYTKEHDPFFYSWQFYVEFLSFSLVCFVLFRFLFVCLFDLLGFFIFLKHFFIQCWKYKLADAWAIWWRKIERKRRFVLRVWV